MVQHGSSEPDQCSIHHGHHVSNIFKDNRATSQIDTNGTWYHDTLTSWHIPLHNDGIFISFLWSSPDPCAAISWIHAKPVFISVEDSLSFLWHQLMSFHWTILVVMNSQNRLLSWTPVFETSCSQPLLHYNHWVVFHECQHYFRLCTMQSSKDLAEQSEQAVELDAGIGNILQSAFDAWYNHWVIFHECQHYF